MRLGAVLFLLLVAASLFNAVMVWRGRKAGLERDRTLRRVDAFLLVWAQHWGDPPEEVKAALLRVLTQYPLTSPRRVRP